MHTTLFVVLALVISVLVVVNLLTNLWAKQHYLLISLWASGVMIAVAWLAGISWSDIGLSLSPAAQTKGLIWSAIVLAIVVVGYAVAAALPITRKGFADARTAQMGVGRFLYHAFLRIPVGTGSSLLFGVWHVLPALDFHASSSTTDRMGNSRKAQLLTVVGQVIGTGAAGVVFALLVVGSGSLLPAIALHASLNALGFALSWAFARKLREF